MTIDSRTEMVPSGKAVYFCPVCGIAFHEHTSHENERIAKEKAQNHLYTEHFEEIATEFMMD